MTNWNLFAQAIALGLHSLKCSLWNLLVKPLLQPKIQILFKHCSCIELKLKIGWMHRVLLAFFWACHLLYPVSANCVQSVDALALLSMPASPRFVACGPHPCMEELCFAAGSQEPLGKLPESFWNFFFVSFNHWISMEAFRKCGLQ